jgi:hypothetical protein
MTASELREVPGKVVEKTLEREFNAALSRLTGLTCGQGQLVLPSWDPQAGPFDSALGQAPAIEMVGEMKWSSQNKVFEVLWDAIKLCSALDGPVLSAFLAYGFPKRLWGRPVECARLLEQGRQPVVPLIRQHIRWWDQYILGDSTGRPSSAFEYVLVTKVADETISYQGIPWVLRVVMLKGEGKVIPFKYGRPLGVDSCG